MGDENLKNTVKIAGKIMEIQSKELELNKAKKSLLLTNETENDLYTSDTRNKANKTLSTLLK